MTCQYKLPEVLRLDYDTWRCGGREPEPNHGLGWTENEASIFTALLDGNGKMCCLGQFSRQMGVPDNLLLDVAEPSVVWGMLTADFQLNAIGINDDCYTTIANKAFKLRQLCKKHGHELEFINFPTDILKQIELER